MPGRDGTGPMGAGSGTGKGLGGCVSASANGQSPVDGIGRQRRAGRGGMQGRGFGRTFACSNRSTTQKEEFEQQRATLQARLDQVDGQLKNL